MELRYGQSTTEIPLAAGSIALVLNPPAPSVAPVTAAEAAAALADPIGAPSLRQYLEERRPRRAVVIVEDKTRRNPEYPWLLELLLAAFAGNGCAVELMVAYGTHPRHDRGEDAMLYGQANLARVSLAAHDARDPTGLTYVGELATGNRLFINRKVAEADLRIALGSISPHAFAGFTGGRKAILPGVSGYESIKRNHALVREEGVGLGVLAGNPIHAEMTEAAARAGLDFIVNIVRGGDGAAAAVVAGDFAQAFDRGVEICRRLNSVFVEAPADVVYVGCGGAPLDASLYFAQRAICAAANVCRPGGTIVVIGRFDQGIGSETLRHTLSKPLPEVLALRHEEIEVGVHSAFLMARNLARFDIVLRSELDPDTAALLHFRPAPSWSAVQAFIHDKHGRDYSAYLIPNGAQVLPEVVTLETRRGTWYKGETGSTTTGASSFSSNGTKVSWS